MCNDVRAPIGVCEEFLRKCVEKGEFGVAEAALADYYDAYRFYTRSIRCGDSDAGARLLGDSAVRLAIGSGSGCVGGDSGADGSVGLCEGARDGGRCSSEGRCDDVAGGFDGVDGDVGSLGALSVGGEQKSAVAVPALSKNARKKARRRARVKVQRGCGAVSTGGGKVVESRVSAVPEWRVAAAPVGRFAAVTHKDVTSVDEQKVFARQWYERKTAENKLAIKEAELRLKMHEQNEASGFDQKKVMAWRMGIDRRIRTLSGESSSRGDAAASSVPSGSFNPPSSVTSVSERERVLERRCQELSAFKAKVESGQFGAMCEKVKFLEAKLKDAEEELEATRLVCINEQRARARDIECLRLV